VRMLRSAVRIAPSRSDIDWGDEWERAWKATPANVWFQYQGDAWVRWFEERLAAVAPSEATRVLKTDAFEDACGFHHLQRLWASSPGRRSPRFSPSSGECPPWSPFAPPPGLSSTSARERPTS